MKKGKLKYVLGLIMATVMLGAAAIPVTEKIVDASSATTYTRTQNADGENVRCQDGYLPENTYDRIGLNAPKDMVIDKVFEGGKEVEYKNFGLTLNELGVYTVTYTVQGEVADELIVTFEVVQGNVGNQTPKATTASIVDGGSGAGLLIACVGCVVGKHCGKSRARNLYKKKKEKGEN